MSPEYAMEGIFSEKSDVFSFGVLMLEIVSGRKINSFYNVNGPLNLVGYVSFLNLSQLWLSSSLFFYLFFCLSKILMQMTLI